MIGHFEKCFTDAVKQDDGTPANVRKALLNIVPHSYGEHESCREWGGYLRNPERYKHAPFPYADLTDFKKGLGQNFTEGHKNLHLLGQSKPMKLLTVFFGAKLQK